MTLDINSTVKVEPHVLWQESALEMDAGLQKFFQTGMNAGSKISMSTWNLA